MIKIGIRKLSNIIVISSSLVMGLLGWSSASAADDEQAQELELEIQLVGENDSPDQVVNTIILPDFSFSSDMATENANNGSDKLTGQEKSANAKSQAYGLIKENKKEKIKKEKVKKDKKEKEGKDKHNN